MQSKRGGKVTKHLDIGKRERERSNIEKKFI